MIEESMDNCRRNVKVSFRSRDSGHYPQDRGMVAFDRRKILIYSKFNYKGWRVKVGINQLITAGETNTKTVSHSSMDVEILT
jgi:hypothetical protein